MSTEKKKKFIIDVTYLALILVLSYLLLQYALPLLLPFVLAFLIAYVLRRPIRFLSRVLHAPKGLVAVLLVVLTYGTIGLLLALAGGIDRMALCSSINYLADSGYLQVRCIEDKAPSSVSDAELEDLEVKLTPRGIQLQRCVKKDPLVDM